MTPFAFEESRGARHRLAAGHGCRTEPELAADRVGLLQAPLRVARQAVRAQTALRKRRQLRRERLGFRACSAVLYQAIGQTPTERLLRPDRPASEDHVER